MAIVQDGWEYDLYDAQRPSGGVLRYDSGRRIRIDGSGLRSGATASRFGNLAGRVRATELASGQVNHALVMVVDCTSGRHVWPAAKTDSKCNNPTDAPPMGARFQLAMSDAQIDALGVPSWKKAILRAMARYGGYVGDSSSGWSVTAFESGSTYTSFGVEDPMVALARRAGIRPNGDGLYVFDMEHGVDWRRYLRVIDPSVARAGPGARSLAPRLSAVSVKPRRVGRSATIRYRLSRAATVTFSFVRGGRRWVGSFSAPGRAGTNRKRFSGRLLGARLRNGSYKATLMASDGSARSKPKSARFRVKHR
jgi:hypothetical protein